MSFPDNEPAITAGGLSALVAAVIALLVAFGAQITTEQREATLGLVAVLAPVAVAVLIRPHVIPVAKIEAVPLAASALRDAEFRARA